jgi:peptidyl-prolyl cis-trans isomerase C
MKIIKTTLAAMCTGLIALQSSLAGDMSEYIPGFYTEWEVSPESGDVGGIEIFVFNSGQGPYVVYTLAEGEPGLPKLVKATLDGNTLNFKVENQTFRGKFTEEGFKLQGEDSGRILKRGSLMNSPAAKNNATGAPDIAASVNGKTISKVQLEESFKAACQSAKTNPASMNKEQKKDGYMQLLNDLINRELLLQAAADIEVSDADIDGEIQKFKSQFKSEVEFQKHMQQSGMDMEKLHTDVRTELAIRRWMDSQVSPPEVSDDEAISFYTSNIKEFAQPETIKASHILFAVNKNATPNQIKQKKEAAAKAAARANGGEDFNELAKELSEEPGANESGGDLGYFPKDRMVKEFSTAAFTLQINEISAPVKTQFGWHVIKVNDKKAAGTVPFSEVKDQVVDYLKSTKQRTVVEKVMEELKNKSDIQIFI